MESPQNKSKKHKNKNFASFNLAEAFKQLKITRLSSWELEVQSVTPSEFFQQRMAKLRRFCDLRSYEESKKLAIDAILEDVLGIVTNGDTWRFYQLTPSGQVYETLPYAIGDLSTILGWLRYLFKLCEHNLP